MKLLLIVCFLLGASLASCRSQLFERKKPIQTVQTKNRNRIGVKGPNFQGTIFTDEYPFNKLFVSDIDSTRRFTPSVDDVEIVEDLLRHQLKALNKQQPNQQFGSPVIHRNLPKYFRQYVGFVDENGDKIIHVQFYWNRYNIFDRISNYMHFNDDRINFESDYSIYFDGGSYHWELNADITQKKLTDLQVNGNS